MAQVITGISGRLLILTILVVMVVEVAIFVPSVARYRLDYLEERLVRAEIAAMTVMATGQDGVGPALEQELLASTGAFNVVVQEEGVRVLALPGMPIEAPVATFDLRKAGLGELVTDALSCLFDRKEVVFRIIGTTERGVYEAVEITLPAGPLRAEMLAYGLRVLQLSLIISIVTAAFVFLVVRRFVVAPLLAVVENIKLFQENPEDPARVISPASRLGEVAEAERALAAMERDVLAALRERGRLASLGEAVAKISHDLRNMLTTGQLMTDRLEMSRDPIVARVLPKLIAALDRAITLCERTLAYGRAEEPPPEPRRVDLNAMLDDVADGLALGDGAEGAVAAGDGHRVVASGQVSVLSAVPEGFVVVADPDQLFRILSNLARNAAEAIRGSGRAGRIEVVAERAGPVARIVIADTGPGIPERTREHLFRPFRGSGRQGGTGLGLAIALELATANGGSLELLSTSTTGTRFLLTLPAGGSARLVAA